MGTLRSAWLIGSVESLPLQFLTIDASPQPIATGSYYLYDTTAGLSLLAKVLAAMTAAGVANPVAQLTGSRKVRLASSASFDVTWGTTLLRDLLGFSQGNLAGASSYVAADTTARVWSPGKPESPMLAPLGVRGHKGDTAFQSVAPYSGRTESVSHGVREYNRFMFPSVVVERVRTASEAGGEFGRWFEQVAVTSSRWKLYRDVQENPGSSAGVTLDTPLGPYVYSADRKGPSWKYDRSRGFDWTDLAVDLDIPCHVVAEYA